MNANSETYVTVELKDCGVLRRLATWLELFLEVT